MNSEEYIQLNKVIILVALFLLLSFFFLSKSGLPECQFVASTGKACRGCGLTRDFISLLKFDFSNLINPSSIWIFSFVSIQALFRSTIIVFGLPTTYSITKIILTDAFLSVTLFLLSFSQMY